VDPAEITRRLRAGHKLVAVNHSSERHGTIQPVAEIGARPGSRCAASGGRVADGRVLIDVERMGIDVLAFTGHKSLLAPTGIGGLYVREGVGIRPTRFGGTGVNSVNP
jgi:selenocysteine lyase/cysteine desulfurase